MTCWSFVVSRKTLPDYTTRRWNSLKDLYDRIQKDQTETIVEFNGISLTTNKRKFSLYDGILTVEKV